MNYNAVPRVLFQDFYRNHWQEGRTNFKHDRPSLNIIAYT